MTEEAIRFTAQVYKVQTLVDGGIRLTLDMPSSNVDTITKLIQANQPGILLEVAAVAIDVESVKQKDNNNNDKVSTRSEWQS
jgi:hypothetical protein